MTGAAPSLGFDVGGQSIKAALVTADGRMLAHASAPTGEQTTSQDLAESIASLRETLFAEAGTRAAAGIGMGFAGAIHRSGEVHGSPHLPLTIHTRVGEIVGARLAAPVVVHNDTDCAAVAEGWGGAADGCTDFLMLAIGTGLGSGLVLGGCLRAGASGLGCEFGHMMVVHGGRRCGCGNLGCLEAYISETGAHGLVDEADPALRERVELRRAQEGGGYAEAVFALGATGDAQAEAIAGAMVDTLGAAIGSAANVLDLTTFVIGGGIAPGVLARLPGLRDAAARQLFARPVSDLDIVPATRGPLAGAIGAARLGMLAH